MRVSGTAFALAIGLAPVGAAGQVISQDQQHRAQHDFWINGGNYKSPTDGSHCCGDNDCKIIAPEEVKATPRGYMLSSGELIPYSEAQQSEDGEYWRCKRHDGSRRCFFAPQPSS